MKDFHIKPTLNERSVEDALHSADEITNLRQQVKLLREALNSLVNETFGALGLAESEIRHAIGNTNFSCITNRVAEARAALKDTANGLPDEAAERGVG